MYKQVLSLFSVWVFSLCLVPNASAVLIDNFSPQDGTVSATSFGSLVTNFISLDDFGGGVLSGDRDLQAVTTNSGNVTGSVSGGLLDVTTSGPSATARIQLVYDGNDNNASISHFGNSFDLTSTGLADRFIFDIDAVSGSAFIQSVIYDGSFSNLLATPFLTNPITTAGLIEVPFSLLTTQAGTGANFSSVSAIQFTIDISGGGNSISIDSICTGNAKGCIATNIVPIPAAAWLFSTGLLGLICLAKRKKTS